MSPKFLFLAGVVLAVACASAFAGECFMLSWNSGTKADSSSRACTVEQGEGLVLSLS
jgi:hypothetical protein